MPIRKENRKMEKVKKYGKFLIAPVIAVAIALLIYAVKGIYPFGGMTIAHADMGQSYETFYHIHIHWGVDLMYLEEYCLMDSQVRLHGSLYYLKGKI